MGVGPDWCAGSHLPPPTSHLPYRIPAPCSIHRARIARSASVMFVLFPGGIVRVATARSWMRDARAAICSGVSKATPAGATPKVRSAGSAEWHAAQRRSTTWRTSEN